MKKLLLSLIAMLGLAACSGSQTAVAENNDKVTKVLELKDFNQLSLGGCVNVKLTQGVEFKVVASGTQKAFDHHFITVRGNNLYVEPVKNKDFSKSDDTLYLSITMPTVAAIKIAGACALEMGAFTSTALGIKASGASKLYFEEIKCKTMEIGISGASKVDGIIFADNLEFEGSGASKPLLDFTGKTISVGMSGASDCVYNVDCELIKAKSSGASKACFNGTADKVEVKSSGASKLDTKNLNKF